MIKRIVGGLFPVIIIVLATSIWFWDDIRGMAIATTAFDWLPIQSKQAWSNFAFFTIAVCAGLIAWSKTGAAKSWKTAFLAFIVIGAAGVFVSEAIRNDFDRDKTVRSFFAWFGLDKDTSVPNVVSPAIAAQTASSQARTIHCYRKIEQAFPVGASILPHKEGCDYRYTTISGSFKHYYSNRPAEIITHFTPKSTDYGGVLLRIEALEPNSFIRIIFCDKGSWIPGTHECAS